MRHERVFVGTPHSARQTLAEHQTVLCWWVWMLFSRTTRWLLQQQSPTRMAVPPHRSPQINNMLWLQLCSHQTILCFPASSTTFSWYRLCFSYVFIDTSNIYFNQAQVCLFIIPICVQSPFLLLFETEWNKGRPAEWGKEPHRHPLGSVTEGDSTDTLDNCLDQAWVGGFRVGDCCCCFFVCLMYFS